MSAPANTASKAAVNLASRSRIKNRYQDGVAAEVHEQVAGLLGDPGSDGMGDDPGDVHVAAAVLDHDISSWRGPEYPIPRGSGRRHRLRPE